MGSYIEAWQTATQKWSNRREQHLHWVWSSDAGADGIFCAAPQIDRSWHMADWRHGAMGDTMPWCGLKRSADGETKNKDVWSVNTSFLQGSTIDSQLLFLHLWQDAQGQFVYDVDTLWEWCCDVRWCMMWFLYVKRGTFSGRNEAMIKSPLSLKLSFLSARELDGARVFFCTRLWNHQDWKQ